MGHVTRYEYDAAGSLLKQTDALGNATTYTYNENGQVAGVTDAEGGTIRYAYDSRGNVASVTDPEGGVTKFQYDLSGNLSKVTDAEGNTTSYSYDLLDRQTGMTDGRGNTWTYAYDAEGRIVSIKDPLNYSHYCGKPPATIEEYIAAQPEEAQDYLRQINAAIKASIPEAEEKISWSMPTYWKGRNLIQFAASKRHIGLYPGPEAVEAFAGRLTEYKTSKGAIQLPYSKPLPLELIGEIARSCEDNI